MTQPIITAEQALDAYHQILEDPGFQSSVAHDLSAAGGLSHVTEEQFRDAVLPALITEDADSPTFFAPPLDVWAEQVQRGYRDLNIPAIKQTKAGIVGYLTLLDSFSGEDRRRPYPTRNPSTERAIALEERTEDFIEMGHVAVRKAITQASVSEAKPLSRLIVASSRRLSQIPGSADKVRVDSSTLRDERELDHDTDRDRSQFLKYVGFIYGFAAKTRSRQVTSLEDISEDPIFDFSFEEHEGGYKSTSLRGALSKVADALDSARIEVDVNMSKQVLYLTSRRMLKGTNNKKVEFTHQVLDEYALGKLTEVFSALDPNVFETPSTALRVIKKVLERRVKLTQLSEQEVDAFWGRFVTSDMLERLEESSK